MAWLPRYRVVRPATSAVEPELVKTAWALAAEEIEAAEARLLEALASGDEAGVLEAEESLANVQRRTGRLRRRHHPETSPNQS